MMYMMDLTGVMSCFRNYGLSHKSGKSSGHD